MYGISLCVIWGDQFLTHMTDILKTFMVSSLIMRAVLVSA